MINKINKTFIVVISTLLVIPILSGCALTTSSVPLHYGLQNNVRKIKAARNVIVGVHVQDLRKNKRVGNKKNGFGMVMAPIYAKKNVADTVRNAIEKELQARGFRIGKKAIVFVNVGITKFYNNFNMGFISGSAVAKLNMTVIVKNKQGEQLFHRKIFATGENGGIMIASGSNAGVALNRALQNGVNILFNDPKFTAALLQAK